MTNVNKENLPSSGKDYADGTRDFFYNITDQLSSEEYSAINTEWKKIEIFPAVQGSTVEELEKINESLSMYKDEIIQLFDFTITSLEIIRILFSGIQNLMAMVVNYIYQTIYNQLDMLLRMGIYSLTVTPDFQDTNGLSLPVTSLPEQAENVYKKFYDFNDPNVPYNLNYSTDAADAFYDEGTRFIERLDAIYDENANNKYIQDNQNSGDFFNLTRGTNKPYFDSNFKDLKDRMELLSKPGGLYEGIFLYFGFNLAHNLQAIDDFREAISKLSFFFEKRSFLRIRNQFTAKKVKRIRIITTKELDGIERSKNLVPEKSMHYDEITKFYDPELKDQFFILPYFGEVRAKPKKYDEMKSPSGSRNWDSTLIDRFDDENKAAIRICHRKTKDQSQTPTMYYRYIDRLYNHWGNSFTMGTDETGSMAQEIFIYEFHIELEKFKEIETKTDAIVAPFQQDYDYFNDTQRIGIFNGGEFLGEGYVVEDIPEAIDADAKGTWFGTSFTDLFGVTDNIKQLQNYVAGTRNTFETNLFNFDELINDLRDLKNELIRMIEMLDTIIDLLKISLKFDGNIWAKYVREEDYDKFTSYLTDYTNAPPTPQQIFKPSANANIAKSIAKLKLLKKNNPEIITADINKIIQEIDDEYGNDEPSTKKLDSWFDADTWGIDQSENANLANQIVGSEIVQGGLIAGSLALSPLVLEQVGRLMANSVWKLGSSAYELIKPANERPLPPDKNSILEELHEQGFSEITSISNYNGNWEVEQTSFYSDSYSSSFSPNNDTKQKIKKANEKITEIYQKQLRDYNTEYKEFQKLQQQEFGNVYTGKQKSGVFEKDLIYYGTNNETERKKQVRNQFEWEITRIHNELRRATADLSNEFGFSQVFVTYLPKGFEFRPIAMLAKNMDLVDQDGSEPVSEEAIESIDRNAVNEKKPKNRTVADSQKDLKFSSIQSSTTIGYEPTKSPDEITIKTIQPFYDNAEIESKNFIELISSHKFKILPYASSATIPYAVTDKANIVENYFGVIATHFIPPDGSGTKKGFTIKIEEDELKEGDTQTNKVTYLLEFSMLVDIKSRFYQDDDKYNRPRLSKIRILTGLIKEDGSKKLYRTGQGMITEQGYINNNDNNSDKFKFGQLFEKTFTAKIEIPKQSLGDHTFYPYFVVGYNNFKTNTHFFGEGTTFEIKPKFKFYRVK